MTAQRKATAKNESVLVIEDDPSIRHFLEISLKSEGYETLCAEKGVVGLSLFHSHHPSLVLLDLGLPDIDGAEVLENIREAGSTPVIILSAREQEDQKVRMLDAGADDYMVKPFGIGELFARIRMVLRHCASAPADTADAVNIGNLRIDKMRREVTLDGTPVHFTPIEYKMLLVLADNRGKVITHRMIQQAVWGHETNDDYQTLRVFMASIRRKLGDVASKPRFVTTEVGVGYRMSDE